MANLISASSAPIAMFGDKEYYDLPGTLDVMRKVFQHSVVDGFELQLEPEWERESPPLTDTHLADWTKTPKYSMKEILALVAGWKLPILSVHASRDIGNYLCSGRSRDLERGEKTMRDSLSLAEDLRAKVCVFHLWNTREPEFDVNRLQTTFSDVAASFSEVKASVENIPTHLKDQTPFSLVSLFRYVTLDLRWAAFYDELNRFEILGDRIVNVHLRGSLRGNRWVLTRSPFSFDEALDTIKNRWKYPGLLTVEPEGSIDSPRFNTFIEAMRFLKT